MHDALRTENYINQTLPHEIKPLKFEKVIAGKIWTISGSLKNNVTEKGHYYLGPEFLSKANLIQ